MVVVCPFFPIFWPEFVRLPCHTPIPGPTRLTDPNRIQGARLYTGTLYFFFFFITESKYHIHIQKNYHRSGVHQNQYTYTESHLQIQNCTFTITNQSAEPTCSEPLLVCWPSCMRKFSDVFCCTYTDLKPVLSFTLSGKHFLYRNTCIYTESQITYNSNRYHNLQEFISHIYIHNYPCNKLILTWVLHL